MIDLTKLHLLMKEKDYKYFQGFSHSDHMSFSFTKLFSRGGVVLSIKIYDNDTIDFNSKPIQMGEECKVEPQKYEKITEKEFFKIIEAI